MTLARVARLLAALFLVVAELGCGDTFRPVAIPIGVIPPSPASSHYVLSLSGNGVCTPPAANLPCNPGSGMRIDVSGDSELGTAVVGLNPVYALILSDGVSVYVANQSEDSVSFYTPTSIGPVNTVSLPAGAGPVFLTSVLSGSVYSANAGNNTLSVISVSSNVVTNTINVGPQPVALAEMPNAQKVYVANRGTGASPVNGSLLSVNTVDGSVNAPIAPPGGGAWNSPIWLAARPDNARIYVLDQGTGTVAAVDTASDTVVGSVSVGAGANYMLYDRSRNRLYVTNPVAGKLSILDASTQASTPTDPLTILAAFNFAGASAPCAGGCTPVSVTTLPDGSRAYVASYALTPNPCANPAQSPPCMISAFVTVINASSNTVTKTISLGVVNPAAPITIPPTFQPNTPVFAVGNVAPCSGARFRLFAAASADSSRVYVSYCDAGSVASISTQPNTSPGTQSPADYLVNELIAPVSALTPNGSGQPPPQNPVFVLAGP